MKKLHIDYCFANLDAACGYTKGSLEYSRNPRKTLESEIQRLMEAAEERENKPIILVGFYEYGK